MVEGRKKGYGDYDVDYADDRNLVGRGQPLVNVLASEHVRIIFEYFLFPEVM